MTLRAALFAVLLVASSRSTVLAASCSGTPQAPACSATPQPPADLGIDLSAQDRCDPLVPARCLLPFPSDYFTVADHSTKTKRRVHFVEEALPANTSGSHLEG